MVEQGCRAIRCLKWSLGGKGVDGRARGRDSLGAEDGALDASEEVHARKALLVLWCALTSVFSRKMDGYETIAAAARSLVGEAVQCRVGALVARKPTPSAHLTAQHPRMPQRCECMQKCLIPASTCS